MELTVKVESGSFEKLIKDGLESLPKEELHDILKEVIKQVVVEAFKNQSDWSGSLITRVREGYSCNERVVLGPLAQAAVDDIDFNPELDVIKKRMLDDLTQNYRQILEGAILQALLNQFEKNCSFGALMENRIRQLIDEHHTQHHHR
jgi:hypothetical protein